MGTLLAGWGPALVPWFGVPPLPAADPANVEAMGWWRLVSFARIAGVGVLGIGVLMLAVRKAIPVIGHRRFALMAGTIAALMAVMVAIQHLALWRTPVGLGAVIFFVAIALTFGFFARGTEVPA